MIDFSDDDLLRSKLVEPGWYLIDLGSYEETLSKAGDSTNMVFSDSKILKNVETASEEFQGVPVRVGFNTKAKGFVVGFLKAMGVTVTKGTRYDLGAFSGRQVVAFVGNTEYNGNMINNVESKFKPA